MKKSILSFFILMSVRVLVFAQFAQHEPIFSTPSASALGYGIFTEFNEPTAAGLAPVNIPIYTLKYKNLSIPIQLDYSVNLVKPDLHPGWTGLGWNLNASGVITRVVNDKPDDLRWLDFQVHLFTKEENVGFFYNYNYMAGDWSSTSSIQNATKDWANYPDYFKGMSTGAPVKDYKPDEFNFSFLNYSGVFYLDEARHWKVRCNQGIKLKVKDTESSDFFSPEFDGTLAFGKFTIVDEKGIQYVFGGTTAAVEYTHNLIKRDQVLPYPKSWYLTSIIFQDGDVINFNYERGETNFTVVPSYYSSYPSNSVMHQGSVIVPSYLKSITTDKETVTFFRSNSTELGYNSSMFNRDYSDWQAAFMSFLNVFNHGGIVLRYDQYFDVAFMRMPLKPAGDWGLRVNNMQWAQLDSIVVNDRKKDCYKYIFDYTKSKNERLKLLSVSQISPSDLTIGNKYSFIYNTAKMLPPYLSDKTDYWGYYNGKAIDLAHYDLSKQPDTVFEVAEVLSQIKYPTGGKRVFAYEGHDFAYNLDSLNRTNPLSMVNNNPLTGGLRVKKIIDYDENNVQSNSVNFFYDKDHFLANGSHQSSGILGGKVHYTFFKVGNNVTNIGLLSWYPMSHNNSGNHVSYSEVTQQFADNSYKVFNYSNFDTNMDENPVLQLGTTKTLNENFTSHANERGKLIKERTYSSNGTKLAENEVKYKTLNTSTDFVRSISTDANAICDITNGGCAINTYLGSAYKTYTNAYVPYLRVKTIYDNPSAVMTQSVTTDYDPASLNKIKEITTDSKGNTISSYYKYPPDFPSESIYQQMVAKNIISPLIEKTEMLADKSISFTKTNYDKFNGNLFLPKSVVVKVGDYPVETTQTFNKYDSKGNLLEVQSPDGPKINYVWGYNKQYPVAKIIGSNYTSVIGLLNQDILDNTTGQYTQLQIQTELNKLRAGLPNTQVTTYTYEPLAGIVSETDIKNQSTYYEYDGLQRLMNIRDQDKNVIKNFSYNYKEAIRGNTKISRIFRKNTCPAGSYGEKVEFIVPADKYYGKNPAEANNLAMNDLLSNGQQYANTNGQCFPNGIYVSLCSDRSRTIISGNYRYIYATYTINVYRDHYGTLLNLQPVDISYSRGNSVQLINVTSTFNLGEVEVQREYIGPRPAGTEGEIISNLVSINYSPNYSILQGCSSGIELEPEIPNQNGLASGVSHNMVRFDSLLELCAYTAATDKDITNVYYEQDITSVIECFTDSNKTAAVADGYYTFFKSVDSGPNKWFKIQFGRIVEEGTCN